MKPCPACEIQLQDYQLACHKCGFMYVAEPSKKNPDATHGKLSQKANVIIALCSVPLILGFYWSIGMFDRKEPATPYVSTQTQSSSSARAANAPCIFSTDLYCYFYLHTEETYPTMTQDDAMADCRYRGGKLPTPYEIETHRDQIAEHFTDPDFPMELWTDVQRYEVNERRQSRTMGLAVSIRPIPGEGYGNTLWVINEPLPDASYACVRLK